MTSGVAGLYRSVIDDVVNNVREAFLDEGVDEQVLQELKQVWENKLLLSKAVPVEGAQAADHHPSHHHPHAMPPQFSIQTQGHGATTAKRGSAAIAQHLPAGSVVQPTVQYQYTTGELGEASKTVTITLPQGVGGSQKPVAIALPAIMQQAAAAGIVMSSSATAAATALPPNIAAGILPTSLATLNSGNVFSHQNADGTTVHYQAVTAEQLAKQGYTLNVTQANPQQPSQQVHLNSSGMIQLDGVNDTSDDDDDDDEFKDDDNDIDNDDEVNDEENDAGGEEEAPLNSGDDVSDEDPSELFDTDNVVVCQYDKITRSRNKWKFHLKDGIMNLGGKDYVFQRASGDAEW